MTDMYDFDDGEAPPAWAERLIDELRANDAWQRRHMRLTWAGLIADAVTVVLILTHIAITKGLLL